MRNNILLIHNKNRIICLNLKEIIYLSSIGNYTSIVLDCKKYLILKSLKKIEEELPSDQFIRCHNSFFINSDFLREYDLKNNTVLLLFNYSIPVSIRRKKHLVKFLIQNEKLNSNLI